MKDIDEITNDDAVNVLSMSSGKDSTAMMLLAIERGVDFKCVFADTGNEHPIVYEYIEYLQEKTGHEIITIRADFTKDLERQKETVRNNWGKGRWFTAPGTKGTKKYGKEGNRIWLEPMSQAEINEVVSNLEPTGNPFLDLCKARGRMPSTLTRFCSIELKQVPMMDQIAIPILESGNTVVSWQGIRADESHRRSTYQPVEYDETTGIIAYRPILLWSVDDVFRMHKRHGVKPNPLYKMGFARVGCMPCIHANKADLKEMHRRAPEHIERIAAWEKEVAKVTRNKAARDLGASGFFGRTDPRRAETGTIEYKVRWATRDKNNGQINFISVTEEEEFDETACSAIYPMVCE